MSATLTMTKTIGTYYSNCNNYYYHYLKIYNGQLLLVPNFHSHFIGSCIQKCPDDMLAPRLLLALYTPLICMYLW